MERNSDRNKDDSDTDRDNETACTSVDNATDKHRHYDALLSSVQFTSPHIQ